MDIDYKKEAKKQYLHYFRFWFIAVGILAVLCFVLGVSKNVNSNVPRANNEAPTERVYDNADVLSDKEEEQLREYIAKAEEELKMDIVLVTISQPVEGKEAKEIYGYRSVNWEQNMRDLADDFWDNNKYGYNKGFEGDGLLLLSNWYDGQAGEWLSTSGKAYEKFSTADIDYLLDEVGYYIEDDPYRAYIEYVDETYDTMTGSSLSFLLLMAAFFVPIIVAVIYGCGHMHQRAARDTTALNAYVAGGKPQLNLKTDDFLRKNVTRRRIETSSGSSSGGGRGGSHRSSSGARHGGGGRRR